MKITCSDFKPGTKIKNRPSYSIGYSIPENDWSTAKQKAHSRSHIDPAINARILEIQTWVEEFAKGKSTVTGAERIAHLHQMDELKNGRVVSKKENSGSCFNTVDQIYKEACEGTLLTKYNTKYSENTLRTWWRSRNRLFKFNPDLTFESITMDTYREYINWENEQGSQLSYIGATIKDWSIFFQHATRKGLNKNYVYKDDDFKKIDEVVDKPYLDDEEIELLRRVPDEKLSATQREVRDRFVINLYIGFRISDLKSLTDQDVEGDVITKVTQKKNKKISIPIADEVIEILDKYDGHLPRQYHEAVVNREIKKIAELAGIDRLFTYSVTKGGRVEVITEPKWKLITNHTARRSAVTNMSKDGCQDSDIMSYVGMAPNTFKRYNKKTAEDVAKANIDHPYFRKKNRLKVGV